MRYFVAVAEELSFTKAARKLRLAQPSLTRQVRNLEEEIGVRLLDRTSNRVSLTEGGRLFQADAVKILALCDESVAAIQRMGRGDAAQLNLGYVANIHYELLPATLGAFRKLWPRVALNLFDLTSAQQFTALTEHTIDLGFVGVSPALSSGGLCSQRVAYDPMVVALAVGSPLAAKKEIKLLDLADEFFICMSAKSDPGDCKWVADTCRRAAFTAKVLQEALDGPSAIRFVKDGLGIALMPEQIAALPHEGVVLRPLTPPLRRESTIAWRADNTSKPLRDYIQVVKDMVGILVAQQDLRTESGPRNHTGPAVSPINSKLVSLIKRS